VSALPGADALPCPWQRERWERLRRTLADGRLPHALLLAGTPGTGRGRFAQALARLLLCQAPREAGACGSCKSCHLMAQGVHADFLGLAPAEPGRRIGVDAVRDVLSFSARTSSLGARKVILVSPLEAFTGAAFNAFLKGLEEPADDTFMLLVAARGQYIPATIRSRCQTLTLPLPQPSEALQWLRDALEAREAGSGVAAGALLECLPGQPLAAFESVVAGSAEGLLALHRALSAARGSHSLTDLERLSAQVAEREERELLEFLQRRLWQESADCARRGERGRLRRALLAVDRLRGLQAAVQSGQNPNGELLRHAALGAWIGVGGAVDDATLAGTRLA